MISDYLKTLDKVYKVNISYEDKVVNVFAFRTIESGHRYYFMFYLTDDETKKVTVPGHYQGDSIVADISDSNILEMIKHCIYKIDQQYNEYLKD